MRHRESRSGSRSSSAQKKAGYADKNASATMDNIRVIKDTYEGAERAIGIAA